MRIGIDARPLVGQRTGIGNYVLGIVQALGRYADMHEFFLYSPRPLSVALPDARWHARIHRGTWKNGTFWLQWYARQLAERDGVDLFWGAHFLLPLGLQARIPAVVTVYDLVPFLFPQTMELRNYLVMRLLLRASLRRAQHVIAISETAKADLHHILRVASEKITVISPGVAPQFSIRDPEEARARVARTLDLTAPYLLAVGTLEPRKNLLTLIRGYARRTPEFRHRYTLAVAGAAGWRNSSIHAAAEPLAREGTLRFLGYVADEELPWLYAGATLLLFPSLYEGFGMPVIEAMACGTPVAASDIPVLREVAGDAATFVHPTDEEAWGTALEALASDSARRTALREAGLCRATRFSFEESARRLLTLWEQWDQPALRQAWSA